MRLEMIVRGETFYVSYVDHVKPEWLEENTSFITFDTETTGLHIKKDRPTLGAVCMNHKVYVFPMTKLNATTVRIWARNVKRVYGHNVVFDMHMLSNCMGYEYAPTITNWGDTMCFARLAVEAVSTRDGGDKIGLKPLAKKYIEPDADRYEKDLKKWMQTKERADKKLLSAMLKPLHWSATRLQNALQGGHEIPDEVMEIYTRWRQEYPKPTYADVPMEIMLPYVASDVIYTQFLVYLMLPEIVETDMMSVVDREFRLLTVVYKMERKGIQVDRDYLTESKKRVDDYIEELYTQLRERTGMTFTVGQHAVIKKMYEDLLNTSIESTDKSFLKKMEAKGDEVAPLISRIRRFEKWSATYIQRILDVSAYDGRFYTSMNQFNPVSGRFSGDAQQFPKDPIYTQEGYEYERTHKGHAVPSEYILYHPRKAFVGRTFYADYSQIELRVQAHYTIPFGADRNLCRAYMPYGCTHYLSGKLYQYERQSDRAEWNQLRSDVPTDLDLEDALEQGWSAWLDPDTGKPWVPTDVHGETTRKALIMLGYNPAEMLKADFKWWRNIGKRFNFMRNYGGGDKMAAEVLDIPLAHARAMNKGYSESFPLVITYQNNIIKRMRERGFCVNLYNRRYYVSDWYKHYKVANYVIQGSCADFLKEKMLLIDQYLTHYKLEGKLDMILCVHDELQFEASVAGMDIHIQRIKAIMEDAPLILVPIVAEVEYTETNWSEKKKWKGVAA